MLVIRTTTSVYGKNRRVSTIRDNRFKKDFEESWKLNKQRLAKMKQLSGLLVPEQKLAFNKIDRAMQKLGPLLEKIVRIRSHEGWNQANTLLGDKAAPIAFKIKKTRGVLGAAITNSVSEPIRNASRMARELAAGNLRQKKLAVVSNDELCELSQSLNQLLDRLKKVQPFGQPSSK